MDVHPVAGLFPMLADDELAELADDIKARGLLHPIVLDADGRVLDGRNRLAACELAGVEPVFVTYDGDDPDGYALAVNIARRHLTKGQQAMIAARALLVSNSTQESAANSVGVIRSRVAQAVTVRDHAPDMVDAVIAGATGLDEAYRIARERKTAADSTEAQLARLRAEDPELAAKVVEGELTLAGAWAERRERAKREAIDRDTGRTAAARLVADLQTGVSSIAIAAQLGEAGLVTDAMVGACRDAADLLEKILTEEEQ